MISNARIKLPFANAKGKSALGGKVPLRRSGLLGSGMILLSVLLLILMGGTALAQPFEKPVKDAGQIAERSKIFQQDLLRRLGLTAQVSHCTHMVQWAVGVRGGNFSYGAICTVKNHGKSRSILMCDDVMVGHFALTTDFAYSDRWVADFTKNNCVGS
jgi:hypothetical protein